MGFFHHHPPFLDTYVPLKSLAHSILNAVGRLQLVHTRTPNFGSTGRSGSVFDSQKIHAVFLVQKRPLSPCSFSIIIHFQAEHYNRACGRNHLPPSHYSITLPPLRSAFQLVSPSERTLLRDAQNKMYS